MTVVWYVPEDAQKEMYDVIAVGADSQNHLAPKMASFALQVQ